MRRASIIMLCGTAHSSRKAKTLSLSQITSLIVTASILAMSWGILTLRTPVPWSRARVRRFDVLASSILELGHSRRLLSLHGSCGSFSLRRRFVQSSTGSPSLLRRRHTMASIPRAGRRRNGDAKDRATNLARHTHRESRACAVLLAGAEAAWRQGGIASGPV